ncbi:hypothetical protein K491DRAFT_773626 [Lophiostoma macrostomum CBS 122681]|uniref:Uncharacterized protein n=1 Tax=Lophiostoma macrostomum CBS 122681 TaxID=1314788 RepID=A0A6A6TT34_9PLEO|nr:hypothetical protein K491DRAFT_773626 [Lophiostoma macrostomum CBS 122681]
MDNDGNYVGTLSQEFRSRELEAFGSISRFRPESARMFDDEWRDNELVPLLRIAYSTRPEIGVHFDFQNDLDWAELIEPWHQPPQYPVEDPIFIERLRLALADPESVRRPSRIAGITDNMLLTIRLLVRRYSLFGGAYRLASLGNKIRVDMAEAVAEAEETEILVGGLFSSVAQADSTGLLE